jgi:hypothetical protein
VSTESTVKTSDRAAIEPELGGMGSISGWYTGGMLVWTRDADALTMPPEVLTELFRGALSGSRAATSDMWLGLRSWGVWDWEAM